jgi:hypothetical protein
MWMTTGKDREKTRPNTKQELFSNVIYIYVNIYIYIYTYSGRLIHCTWIGWDPSQLATGPNQPSSDTFFLKGILATPSGWYTFFNSLAGEREIPLCLRTHREHFSPCGKPIEFRLRRDLGQRPQDVTNFF